MRLEKQFLNIEISKGILTLICVSHLTPKPEENTNIYS